MSEHDQAQRIRAFCDGELDLDEGVVMQRQVEDDPDLAARVRFEKALRTRVGKAMSADMTGVPGMPGSPDKSPAPSELRERCAKSMADADADADADIDGDVDVDGEDASDDVPERRSWLTGPPRANVFAVVASLALIAAAVLFGIFGQPIDSLRAAAGTDLVAESAGFVSSEHVRCASAMSNRDAKTAWESPADAASGLERHLGAPVPIPNLDEFGYRFAGAGACGLPGSSASGHLIYVRRDRGEDGCREAMLSLFVVPDTGQFDVVLGRKLGQWNWIEAGSPPTCDKRVACATDGRLYYFLVCCNESRLTVLADMIGRSMP